jgi:hypothetical protein
LSFLHMLNLVTSGIPKMSSEENISKVDNNYVHGASALG